MSKIAFPVFAGTIRRTISEITSGSNDKGSYLRQGVSVTVTEFLNEDETFPALIAKAKKFLNKDVSFGYFIEGINGSMPAPVIGDKVYFYWDGTTYTNDRGIKTPNLGHTVKPLDVLTFDDDEDFDEDSILAMLEEARAQAEIEESK